MRRKWESSDPEWFNYIIKEKRKHDLTSGHWLSLFDDFYFSSFPTEELSPNHEEVKMLFFLKSKWIFSEPYLIFASWWRY